MSTTEAARVSVRILEKEYFVACPHDERAALLDAAEFLNGRMREIRDTGKVVGLDRVAAMNLANELLRIRDQDSKVTGSTVTRVRAVRERAEAALARNQQLEL